MELGRLMEREGVWIPLTPGKPALTSEQGDGKESNEDFLCTECFDAMRCTQKCVINEVCEFSPGMLDELEAGLGVAGKEPEDTTTVKDETSCVQEETVKSSPSEHDSKKTHGADESHDGIGSIPTPSKTKETRKRRNDGNDMNKKASQRPRVKKHRPKIFDDSKPKKVPKAQTPRATSRPKTPKPATPNRVQERRTQSKKNKSTVSSDCTQKSTCSGIEDVGQDVQEASRASIVVRSCKRVLDFDQHPVNKESKSHEEPLLLGFDFEKFDSFHGDNNTQQHEQESSITRKQEQVDKYGRKYAHYYQRRKKISSSSTIPIPTLLVYRRSSRKDLCLHNSKKCGPVFPKLFKKQRAIRKKVKIKVNHWYIIADKLNKSLVNRSYGKLAQTTRKKVQNRVNKSKDKKGVVKPDVYIDEFRRVFLHPRRKRSIMHTHLRESFRMVPYDLENYLLRQEENFLQITECLPPHEVPVQRINSFTSPHYDFPRFNNSLGNLNWLQLQEAVSGHSLRLLPPERQDILHTREDLYELQGALVLKSQSLPPKHKDILHTREDLYELPGPVVLASQSLPSEHKDILHTREDLYELQGPVVLASQSLPSEHKDILHTREDLYELQGAAVLENQCLPPKHKDVLHTREKNLYEFNASKVEDLIRKLASLEINDQCKELVVRDQNVIGALVNVLPPKKRKMVPKVDLDNETLRVWKLLMENDESEPVEETDKDKEEWWEKQRNIFRGRVDSFIAKMHLIQVGGMTSNIQSRLWGGAKWATAQLPLSQGPKIFIFFLAKSKEGLIFLLRKRMFQEDLQNSSACMMSSFKALKFSIIKFCLTIIFLCSSAFMYLAARFPANSRSREVNDNFDVPNSQESVGSNAQVYDGCSKNNVMEQDMSASDADVSKETPTMEQDQNILQVQDKPCVDENSITFRKLLEAEEEDYLKQFCRAGIDELESSLSESKLEDEEQRSSINNLPSSNEPSAPTLDLNVSLCKTSEGEIKGQQKSTTVEEPKVVVPISSLQSEVTIEQGVDSANNHKEPLLENELKGKKKNQKENKQEPKTDWVEFKKSYCKTGEKESNMNCMDAVDWDAVRRAPVEEIAKIIEDRGMHNVIARRIKEFLDRMHVDHGTLDLEWLRDIPPDKAKEFLLSIEGIGLKSVECVRLLTLHHNAFPVDTNVGRVATRLGWVPLQPLPDALQIHLLNAYPMVDNIQKYLYPRLCTLDQKTLYELHYQLITFGKVFCTKRNPNCNACPMRAECRHYASAFARLALPGTKESSNVTSIVPAGNEEHHSMHDLEVNNLGSSYHGQSQTCEPIIEVPPSPEPEVESIIGDIEDLCEADDDEIPTIRLNTEEFRETLKETMDTNKILIPEADMSKALIAFSAEAANIPVPPKKFVAKSRTMHLVYELPDLHPCLAGFEERDLDDPTPYLLAVWYPGEISNSLEYTENRACPAASNNLEETVKATLLIPCRTANRGTFPLNGTYFQVNEVFADDETSHSPMDVPRGQLCNLPLRELGCGTSATSIFKGPNANSAFFQPYQPVPFSACFG
ncbi:hypothetical protein M8C21_018907, partial [Ambrosia artemisiifolia]